MAITFPSNPTTNQTYTYNTRVWTFDGTHWTTTGANNYATNTPVAPILVSDTVPGATTVGSMWIDSSTGTLSVYIGGAWVLASAGVVNVADGSISGDAITDGSITEEKLSPSINLTPADYSITGQQLANTLSLGNIAVSGNSTLGAISNVKITGGSTGQLISTDGTGNLSFINAPSSFNAGKAYTLNLLFGG